MRRGVMIGIAVLALAGSAVAQQPAVGTSSLAWQQNDTDAPTLTYLLGVNGSPPVPIMGVVTCTPANMPLHDCRVLMSDLGLAQGQYTLTVQARRTVASVDFDSVESAGLTVVRADMPPAPAQLVIIVSP